MPAPRQPDYFLLSIWTDVPDPDPANPNTFGRPGTKVWEYRADDFDEVMVGFDKHPETGEVGIAGFEPVYRYSVRLPQSNAFCPTGRNDVYWLSVVAAFEDDKTVVYPWGWTNHPQNSWGMQQLATLAHWTFDQTGGLVAPDSSGNGNDGTLKGDPVWRPYGGWFNGAIDLDGKGDGVIVKNPAGFNFAPNSFSVSAWVNARQTKGQWRAILEYNRDGLNDNRFGLWIDPEGRFHFRVGWTTWHSAQSLNPNQWYHLVATYNASNERMNLYVDGLLDGQTKKFFGFNRPAVSTLTIGVRGSQDAEYFDGLIDDVRVFDVTLAEEDILALAGAGRNEDAVAADLTKPSATAAMPWQPLFDQTGDSEDASFVLFTDPAGCVVDPGSPVKDADEPVKEDAGKTDAAAVETKTKL